MSTQPTPFDTAAAQAVFDALDAYIAGTPYTVSNASVMFDGGGTTHSMSCNDRTNASSFTYTVREAGSQVAITPTMADLGPGETLQFTATATDSAGVPIAGAAFTWVLAPGALGTVSPTGLYTAPAAIAAPAMETLTANLTGGQSWTTVTVQLHV
jgi:hypothetical protein